jgi:hypothetical protein
MKRIHYYHADGSTLGGILTRPRHAFIPSQAQVSLSPSGGGSHDKKGAFAFDDIVSCSETETLATGGINPEANSWCTSVTATVSDLNIRHTFTADRVVAQISVEHPPVGYTPKVTFVGSQFENPQIAGVPIKVVINKRILALATKYPDMPWPQNEEFLEAIRDQRRKVLERGPIPDWATHLLTDGADPTVKFDQRGYFLCSLVDSIEGDIPGETCGHLVKVPDIGTFIFGALAVDHGSFRLVMVRAELGSGAGGSMSAAAGHSNGTSGP